MTYFCFPKDVSAEKFFFKGCELEEEWKFLIVQLTIAQFC
jgi:hypothetical protein